MPSSAPSSGADWITSAAGREFITQSSRRWREADVAAGPDETAASAAADRTLAAYTGLCG